MNCVCTGGVETPMTTIINQEALHPLRCWLLTIQLPGHFAKPEKIADAIPSLASDDTPS